MEHGGQRESGEGGSGFMLAPLPLASCVFSWHSLPLAAQEYRVISPLLPWHVLLLLFRILCFGGGVCYEPNVSPKIPKWKP